MSEKGKVRVPPGKDFGFVKAADGTEVFVHRSSYPGKMDVLDGDEISYDIDITGPKGPRTKDVTVVSRGTARPATPRPSPTATAAPVGSSGMDINWNLATPIKNGRTHTLPLTLSITGAKGKMGVEVKLNANGASVDNPSPNPSPDGKGDVVFLVPLPAANQLYAFVAEVLVDGTVVKTSTHIWEKRPAKKTSAASVAAIPATAAELKLPEIEVVNPPRDPDKTTGKFLVNVVTRKDGKKTNRNFAVISDQTIEIQQSLPTGLAIVSTFTASNEGEYPLYIDFDGDMAKITLKLDNGKETVVYLRK